MKKANTAHRKSKACLLILSLIVTTSLSCTHNLSATTSDTVAEKAKKTKEKEKKHNLLTETIEYQDNHLYKKFKKDYSTPKGHEYLSAIMKRSTPYQNFIIEELIAQNMPFELLFLPVIESGYYEKARSRSGAMGIWQFMKNSVGGYDIYINDWMDERRDPWKSSQAAIKKLKWNYEQLGDWPLALAAYNAGLGAIQRAIKKGGKADYWYLSKHEHLKTETIHYVPKFLAISEILLKSEELGIDWGDTSLHPPTTTITVKQPIDLGILEKELELEKDLLKKMNPSLLHNITPPQIRYPLRLPIEYEQQTHDLLSQNKLLLKYYMYTIKSGDTLYALAHHYGVKVETIMGYNTNLKPSTLKIGKTIIIPALKPVDTYKGKADNKNINFSGRHTIVQGDTLWSIALKHNVQVERLAAENNIGINSILKLGNTLKVPIQ